MKKVIRSKKIDAVLSDIVKANGWKDYYYFFSKSLDWANFSGECVGAFSTGMAQFLKDYREAGVRYSNPTFLKTDTAKFFTIDSIATGHDGDKLKNHYHSQNWQSGLILPTYGYGGVMSVICVTHSESKVEAEVINQTTEVLNQWRGKFNEWARALVDKQQPAKVEELISLREIDCMSLVADGKTSHQIAEILGISKRTVDYHIQNSILKLGVSTRSQAALALFLDPLPQLGMITKHDVL